MDEHDPCSAREQQTPWPQHGRFLIQGVNDTWNEYQKFCKEIRKLATSKDWKAAREALHAEYQQFIAEGGMPLKIEKEFSRSLQCTHSAYAFSIPY
jgi:hypothetical protein